MIGEVHSLREAYFQLVISNLRFQLSEKKCLKVRSGFQLKKCLKDLVEIVRYFCDIDVMCKYCISCSFNTIFNELTEKDLQLNELKVNEEIKVTGK